MVIMEERNRFIQLTNDYLDGKVDESEFFGKMEDFEKSKDYTISQVAYVFQIMKDSFKYGPFNSHKENWDYGQRMLLILKSGIEFEDDSEISPGYYNQCFYVSSILSLALYCGCVTMNQFPWILCNLILYLISFPLGKLSDFEYKKAMNRLDCYPFKNEGEIRKAVRLTGNFRKRRFPAGVAGEKENTEENRNNSISIGDVIINSISILLAPIYILLLSSFRASMSIFRLKFPAPETNCR